LLGGIAAGFLGVAIGGVLADAWRRRDPRGRLYFAIVATLVPAPILPWLLLTESTSLALALNFPLAMAGSMWIGVGASTVQDLMLPRMRATARPPICSSSRSSGSRWDRTQSELSDVWARTAVDGLG
jgi:hypothetical protein